MRSLKRLALIGALIVTLQTAVPAQDTAELPTIHAQPSFTLATGQVDLAVTHLGGQMAPVTFYADSDQPVRPYYISPWQDEPKRPMPAPVMVPLRGDFFCMPFGGNAEEVDGEKHPPHGETAGSEWKYVGTQQSGDVVTLTLAMDTKVRPGRVTKELSLIDGQNVVYLKHTIEGFAGRVPLGHHATLAMPETEGAVRIAVSPFRFGRTNPGLFSDPRNGEYQSLLPDAKWTDLAKVPVAWKESEAADLTRMPARFGHADLVQLANESWEATGGPAWTTATFTNDGFLWFSLKDADVLCSTVFWIENHGRHGAPWSGRNNCLGLEDVTAYFADGLAPSLAENKQSKDGLPTTVELRDDRPTFVNYIQGTAKIPEGFDVVRNVEFGTGEVTFVSASGKRVAVPVRHEFLRSGKL